MARLDIGLEFLSILSTRKCYSVEELAQRLNLDKRSVQRLKNELVSLRFDIETSFGPGGGYRLVGSSQIPLAMFSKEEKEYITSSLLELLGSDSKIYSPKHRHALERLIHHFDQERKVTHIDTVDTKRVYIADEARYFEHVEILKEAIKNHRRVMIQYETSQLERRCYRFEPYELFIVNQIWYVGGLNENDQIRYLKLTRILEIEVLDKHFRYDEPSANEIKINNFGFKIEPQAVGVLVRNNNYFKEFIWGHHQTITQIDSDTYRIDVEFVNRLSAQSFILSGGHYFQVLTPPDLQDWIKEEAQKILENYNNIT